LVFSLIHRTPQPPLHCVERGLGGAVLEKVSMTQKPTYGELARLFIRMSLTAFGGPAAHLAMGQDEIVRRRGWLTREEYLDLMAATNLIPGPNSTETMIHVGYKMRGIPGALLTGACFIIPAAVVSLILAILYVNGGGLPQVQSLLWGIQPVIVAIIIVAAWRLAPGALKTRELRVLFVAALVVEVTRTLPEAVVIIGAGLLFALWRTARTGTNIAMIALLPAVLTPMAQTVINLGETARASALDLFWYFLKIGSVLFGSGYVLVTYIQTDLVDTFGWLTARELLDSVAIGQFTPGPVLTTTTVVGYIIAGLPGALTATLGIFLPSFVLVILTAPLIPRMRRSKFLSAFLDGANTAVLAAIVVTAFTLALVALRPLATSAPDSIAGVSALAVVLLAASIVGLMRFKLNATILLVVGAVAGLIYAMLVT